MNSIRSSNGETHAGLLNTSDRRASCEREELERQTLRREQLALQCSPLKTPEERIGLWERLHALVLPRGGTHKLVRVIATQTGLSVQEVQSEQQRRAGHRTEVIATL